MKKLLYGDKIVLKDGSEVIFKSKIQGSNLFEDTNFKKHNISEIKDMYCQVSFGDGYNQVMEEPITLITKNELSEYEKARKYSSIIKGTRYDVNIVGPRGKQYEYTFYNDSSYLYDTSNYRTIFKYDGQISEEAKRYALEQCKQYNIIAVKGKFSKNSESNLKVESEGNEYNLTFFKINTVYINQDKQKRFVVTTGYKNCAVLDLGIDDLVKSDFNILSNNNNDKKIYYQERNK